MKKIIIIISLFLLFTIGSFLFGKNDTSDKNNINNEQNKKTINLKKEETKEINLKERKNKHNERHVQNATNIIKSYELENYKSKYHLSHYEYYDYVKVDVNKILNLKSGDVFSLNLPNGETRQIKITKTTEEPLMFMPESTHYRFLGEPLNKKASHYNFKITGGKAEETGKYHFTMKLKIDSGVYIMKSEGENGFLFKNQLDRERTDIVDTGERPLTDEEADKIHNSKEFKKFYEENKDFIEQEEKEYKEWQEQFKQ
jgi:hypothetical protein